MLPSTFNRSIERAMAIRRKLIAMTDPPELSPFKEDVTNNKVRLYPKNAGCSLEFMENLLMGGDNW